MCIRDRSSSVVSCAFSVLCVYSKFGHHPHPLGYLSAKFCFFRGLHCWASPWRKIAYSITHPAYLMPQEPKCLHFGITDNLEYLDNYVVTSVQLSSMVHLQTVAGYSQVVTAQLLLMFCRWRLMTRHFLSSLNHGRKVCQNQTSCTTRFSYKLPLQFGKERRRLLMLNWSVQQLARFRWFLFAFREETNLVTVLELCVVSEAVFVSLVQILLMLCR